MSAKVDIDGNGNIVIQNAEGAIITINPAIPEEVRQALINYQSLLANLPDRIIQLLIKNNTQEPPIKGASVYLSQSFMLSSYGVAGVSLSVRITNLTKEIRFFNNPFFKVSTPLEKGVDTFAMTNVINPTVHFPKKMEYGEVIKESYRLVPENIRMFETLLERDPETTITAYVSTTLGEVYNSDPYSVKNLVEQGQYVK